MAVPLAFLETGRNHQLRAAALELGGPTPYLA
jgi:hypothetical protein